jgi:hypothetical protein
LGIWDFNLEKQVDAIIITGRSTSYLTTNYDLNENFASLFNNITEEGIIAFDFIDANRFIPYINENRKNHTQVATQMFMVEWTAKYYTFINGKKT